MEYAFVLVVVLLAFGNGANDNFKGFATVWGADTLTYRQALTLATVATVAGSIASLYLADGLVKQFSGRGLVPDAIAAAPWFIQSVAAGAALTILVATRAGFPVSTTHALIGGLIGAGLAAPAGAVALARLGSSFFLPLLLSPLLAAALGLLAYRGIGRRLADKDCLCLVPGAPQPAPGGAIAMQGALPAPARLVMGEQGSCDALPAPARIGLRAGAHLVHVSSATLICFARSVNDTPKLAALLLAASVTGARDSMLIIAVAMAAGGLLYARRVAQTMSKRLARLDNAQGTTANLITAGMVLLASSVALPVSTTHVAVGAIAGVGTGAATIDRATLKNVLLSWVVTLPLAAIVAFIAALSLR
ncbi:inorganic phosphate transporter [Massilia sp. H6]|uniref:inorganic phosphate transporter n=1 Tax=Massilia sp. H6 TaxID=2970464 RepID=UPI002169E23A|nr:inorganic phosphate transporter [Massilia sp. H6]UVW30041.1 inorganic phosphate transporter [Massilia sp. H6]